MLTGGEPGLGGYRKGGEVWEGFLKVVRFKLRPEEREG